ncbi:eukaryotic translation initiation factor 2 subunit beta [Penicillium argentinense]|uniref:Eukaryotic translation initiation factor 2 subunit beta n=1 Tax=Penicillium argentinense TaxID=1131581 RepID=A0A9W9G3F1_9EURO|nr:eukaryotic translation initiation factor 2 subunit beta [Penicillium argentinense]KAJ5111323.1 eukaryotic translation initiation factor 2 subunit beta [Penicillium argentinense]
MDTNGQVTDAPPAEKPIDQEVDEATEMFKNLSKKKKSKKSKDTDAAEGDEAPAAEGEFDPSLLKKKKKKPSKKDAGDFEAKLKEHGVTEDTTEEQAEEVIPEGDLEAGTGIWAHDATQAIPYSLLVSRFFSLVQSHHPDLLSSGTKSYKIPPPIEYVTCKTCRSPDTELNKGENRLYFVTCNSCGSRRSVAAIKTGFRGQVGRRKRTG